MLFELNTGFLYKPTELIHVKVELEVEVGLDVLISNSRKIIVNFFLGKRFFVL